VRRLFGFGYWSLSAYVKQSVKKVVSSISRFEDAVAHYAELHHVDGIVCGHIHTPAVRQIRGVQYYNTGDWVESSTALVEHFDGRLELVYWREVTAGNAMVVDTTPSDLADKSGLLTAAH
jgi:UDP-2,3-diacylglucosamine pyrophosphatase LpxH